MFYDLNVLWSPKDNDLPRTLAFLDELGYNVVALTHTLSGKPPADLSCPIPTTLPFPVPPKLKVLRRCTLVLDDHKSNHRIAALSPNYDIVALRPTSEITLQQACHSLDCDIISVDLTVRLDYYFKFKMLSVALQRGVRFEICYAPGVVAIDASARANLIGNTTQLLRATRGRGLIISSEARRALGCRGPWDVVNLLTVWGLPQEKGREAIDNEARSVVATAAMKRTSFRGAVDIIYGGERQKPKTATEPGKDKKRKAEDDGSVTKTESQQGLTRNQARKQAKSSAKSSRPQQMLKTSQLPTLEGAQTQTDGKPSC
ncbi:PHP domain-like protein [Aulographum hederae CBS 113979]|uniref:PHP domain-like protein n=1 Tax=Aulographum hederae CBS 113979 TaxID=1176131 RepID=A0A6G1H9M1_9PEZI|nr:PHP domain-like protein [Aulographum hederae CBS 113979]